MIQSGNLKRVKDHVKLMSFLLTDNVGFVVAVRRTVTGACFHCVVSLGALL